MNTVLKKIFYENKILFTIEPIGGAAPKFSSSSKSIGTFEEHGGESLALVCPAQAYPLPSFRYTIQFVDAVTTP